MNFEEKILTMLTEMQATQIEQGKQLAEQGKQLTAIDSRLAKVESTQAEQCQKLDSIDARLKKVEFTQENRVLPSLRVIAESHGDLRKELASKESVSEIRNSVNLALSGVKTHTSQITALTERVAKLEKAN